MLGCSSVHDQLRSKGHLSPTMNLSIVSGHVFTNKKFAMVFWCIMVTIYTVRKKKEEKRSTAIVKSVFKCLKKKEGTCKCSQYNGYVQCYLVLRLELNNRGAENIEGLNIKLSFPETMGPMKEHFHILILNLYFFSFRFACL